MKKIIEYFKGVYNDTFGTLKPQTKEKYCKYCDKTILLYRNRWIPNEWQGGCIERNCTHKEIHCK